MDRVAMGLFEDQTRANAVAEALARCCFPREHIHVLHPQAGAGSESKSAGAEHGVFHRFLVKLGLVSEAEPSDPEGSSYGMRESESRLFSEGLTRGGTIVAVVARHEAELAQAETILEDNGAIDVDERVADVPRSGWVESPPVAPATAAAISTEQAAPLTPPTEAAAPSKRKRGVRVYLRVPAAPQSTAEEAPEPEGVASDVFPADYREHFERVYGSSGNDFDVYLPAYQFGAVLSRYTGGGDWNVVEAEARHEWEQRQPESWDNFHVAIQHGFERTQKGKASVTRPATVGGAPTGAAGEREPVKPQG